MDDKNAFLKRNFFEMVHFTLFLRAQLIYLSRSLITPGHICRNTIPGGYNLRLVMLCYVNAVRTWNGLHENGMGHVGCSYH